MDISLQELKKKYVIDTNSGKNLGKICDLIIDSESGIIKKLVLSGCKNSIFCSEKIEIDYACITKIGEDSILYKKCNPKPDNCKDDFLPPCNPCGFDGE